MKMKSISGAGILLALMLVLPGQKVHGEEASLTEDSDVPETATASETEESQELSAPDVYVSGKVNDITWSIDMNGKLTISGTGDWGEVPPWLSKVQSGYNMYWKNEYSSYVTSAEVNVSGMTRTNLMFLDFINLTDVNLRDFDTSQVTNMGGMFLNCSSLESLDLSNFDTSQVTNMTNMFKACSSLESLNLSNFDTSRVRDMPYMFQNCESLESLNLSGFDIPFNTNTDRMFEGCSNLKIINAPRYTGNSIELPSSSDWIWRDSEWTETKVLPQKLNYTVELRRYDKGFAAYDGYDFYRDKSGEITCKDRFWTPVIDEFKCDGTYTYYFQADGTAMKDRLTYHPDGKHIIYFDGEGHEVFSNFANVKKSIAGVAVDDLCFFDVYGYLYVDVVTYDKAGKELYYANPYGVLSKGWFQFSDKVMCADGTPWAGAAGNYGYAKYDGVLVRNTWLYDWEGRLCYMQGNGVALYP